jgi:hypothetical protein
MSHLPGVADALGWLLALVAGAAIDRTHLDSTRRCGACLRTQALLPDLVLARRLDDVAVIGRGIALRIIANVGLRSVATQVDVPHTTVRTWWHRFRARSPTMLTRCSVVAVALDGTAVRLTTSGEHAALDVLQVAWQRAHVRFGDAVGDVWRFWSRISGGHALGTNTTSPWAGGPRVDWMAASPFGGHVLERRIH